MSKKATYYTLAVMLLVAVVAVTYAAFTDVNSPQYHGFQELVPVIDSNFALIESGAGGGATSLNVTNGQAVTVAAGAYVLNGIGGADNTTNTITLVNPSAAGWNVTFAVAVASSNLVLIADSGTVAASGAIEMDNNDTCQLMSISTGIWALVSEHNN